MAAGGAGGGVRRVEFQVGEIIQSLRRKGKKEELCQVWGVTTA